MLVAENATCDALNQAGTLATANFLKRFDTDGSPIVIGQTKLTSKGTVDKEYQTPYGATTVSFACLPKGYWRENVLSNG
jgi:hypothetical protein